MLKELIMLQVDITLLIVAVTLYILMVTLNKVFFRPVGEILDKRENKIETETSKIKQLATDIEDKTILMENVLKDAKRESLRIKEELIRKGEKIREDIIERTRNESKASFNNKMAELDREISAAEEQLKTEITIFSDKIKDIFI